MVSKLAGASGAAAGANFHFVQAQDSGADTKRRARSHAVKRALQQKRKRELEAQGNFRIVSSKSLAEDASKGIVKQNNGQGLRCQHQPQLLRPSPSSGALDPFEVLAVDSRVFQKLLYDSRARQASEPVFSVGPDSSFHSFPAVFRGGLSDPALGNAVMLMLTFSVADGAINSESLRYQTLALGQLRERMGSVEKATSLGTLGTILFLAGVEARLGMRDHVQTHLHAIGRLLELGKTHGLSFTAGMKRAIFWQDLNASIMTGSSRIVDHHTFVELHWARDPFAPHAYVLPDGFEIFLDVLDENFTAILEDVHALQLIRDQARLHATPDPLEIAYINNHQASIQSRLLGFTDLSPLLDCIRLAAYLCSSMLCCRVWCGRLIPNRISTLLLGRLEVALAEESWEHRLELLRWLICMGGSFATEERVRTGFLGLVVEAVPQALGQEGFDRFLRPEPDLDVAMRKFIWSKSAFLTQVYEFWDDVGNLTESVLVRTSNDEKTA